MLKQMAHQDNRGKVTRISWPHRAERRRRGIKRYRRLVSPPLRTTPHQAGSDSQPPCSSSPQQHRPSLALAWHCPASPRPPCRAPRSTAHDSPGCLTWRARRPTWEAAVLSLGGSWPRARTQAASRAAFWRPRPSCPRPTRSLQPARLVSSSCVLSYCHEGDLYFRLTSRFAQIQISYCNVIEF
jgi:hypothetical protein